MTLEVFSEQIKAQFSVNAGILPVSEIPFHPELRALCEQNSCGGYGKNWMCPPLVGEIHELIAKAQTYQTILVYNKVYLLEDSLDYEGMMEGQKQFKEIVRKVASMAKAALPKPLLLGAGGCQFCPECAARENKPCRSPENAMPSLESYGIQVSTLAKLAGLKYINGQNTVTYFAGVLI